MRKEYPNLVVTYDDGGKNDLPVLTVSQFTDNDGLTIVNTIVGWNATLIKEMLLSRSTSNDDIEVS